MAVITKVSPMTSVKPDSSGEFPDGVLEIQRLKHDVAIYLIEEWLADESGYDESVWCHYQRKRILMVQVKTPQYST